ncbi:MAG: class II fructose-bisphosphate aldolase [Chloroherpetonaceae bacterium]|nr:class II fructose-bisphosphate aldolase [Chloroherpetonaceae bacterium]
MPLVATCELLRDAQRRGYAVPGFEPYNLEQIQAVLEAAEEERAPVLIQLWAEVLETYGMDLLVAIVRTIADRIAVPVGLHLDHATDETLVERAIVAGFTSVMFDGSALPLEENVARTRRVVRKAHAYGVAVEAELGIVGRLDPADDVEETLRRVADLLTDPSLARRFVEETGTDILAPAVGTIHGCPLPLARLDIPRIAAIARAVQVPLALHGGSGVGEEALQQAIAAGIAKVNIDTEVRAVSIAALKEQVARIGETGDPVYLDYARYPRAVRAATAEAVRQRIRMVGANGRA